MKKNIVVLISGNGTNLQALIDATNKGGKLYDIAQIVLVVSNITDAKGLDRARKANIETLCVTLDSFKKNGKTRQDYDDHLADCIVKMHPSLIVLAGWMLIVSRSFIDRFNGNVINLHPALQGMFDGSTNAIELAYEAFQENKISYTGVTVHYAIPAVDKGDVVLDEIVPIIREDTLESLQRKIHIVEHRLIVDATLKILVNPSL